jgi:hypothetical protein
MGGVASTWARSSTAFRVECNSDIADANVMVELVICGELLQKDVWRNSPEAVSFLLASQN